MLIPITNSPREYSWGSKTLIPALQGRAPSAAPEAEIWYGDHPGSPSLVGGSARTLDAVLRDRQQPALPFLMKLLAAGSSLSIQAHPTKAQAVAGFAREQRAGIPLEAAHRLYRDDNHKPEIIVALSDRFTALVGLRPLAQTRRLLADLGAAPAIVHLGRMLAEAEGAADPRPAMRDTLSWALTQVSDQDVADLTAALPQTASAEFAAELGVLQAAASEFPGDRGLFVALLMNLVTLRRGQGLFAPAGVLHAYQSGLGVEVMAASDNVLRGGLTPKHVDVPELLQVVDAVPGKVPLVATGDLGGNLVDYAVPVHDFALIRAELRGARVPVALRGATIVLATAGEVRVAEGGGEVSLRPGEAVCVTGGEQLVLAGDGEAFVAGPGV